MQPQSIPPALCLLALAVLAPAGPSPADDAPRATALPAQRQPLERADAPGDLAGEGWAAAPAYVELFAPLVHRTSYGAFTSPFGLDEALAALESHPAVQHPPGAWEPHTVGPLDAFGRSGAYNRWRLMRLYGSQTVRIARGPAGADGRVREAWTLVSPYPSPGFDRLERGTLLLVLQLPPL